MPQQSCPVVGPRSKCSFIEESIIARRERVMRDDANTLLRQARMLIEIPECIEESRGPGISSARRIGCFGEPERLSGLKAVAQTAVETVDCVGARQPLFRKSRRRRCSE